MEERRIEEELTYPIRLCERVRSAVDEAESFKAECSNVAKYVDTLVEKLRVLVRFTSSAAQPLYDRPVRRIVGEVSKNLERALTLVRKCKRGSVLRRVVTIISAADFRKSLNLLEASVGDMTWLVSTLKCSNGSSANDDDDFGMSLPPMANNDPMLAWVWFSLTSIYMSPLLVEKIEAANEISGFAKDNDRNKQIIVEEGGVPPLLKLLLQENGSPEAQIAGATALYHLANETSRVEIIMSEGGVSIIVKVLADSPMKVQTWAARLVARMAENNSEAKDNFGRENAIRPLVTHLSFETFTDDQVFQWGKQSIHSIVQINKELGRNSNSNGNNLSKRGSNDSSNHLYRPYVNSFSSFHSESGSSRGGNRKERENESPEVKHNLKTSCAVALWMLARESVNNSRRITETKGLLCLAKLVEKEEGELQYNCLMTIKEITSAAESDADLRRAAFKTNSPAAKAVVEQLLRVIGELDSPTLQIPAIRSIGSLARTFPARETRVIAPLVAHLSNRNQDVGAEAAIALAKFAGPGNFLCEAHSKTIVESNSIPALMGLLRGTEWARLHGLVLLCYLALHAGNNQALEQTRVLTALDGVDRTLFAQYPELKELVSKAIYHINLYHSGLHSQRLSFVP